MLPPAYYISSLLGSLLGYLVDTFCLLDLVSDTWSRPLFGSRLCLRRSHLISDKTLLEGLAPKTPLVVMNFEIILTRIFLSKYGRHFCRLDSNFFNLGFSDAATELRRPQNEQRKKSADVSSFDLS